MHDGDKDLNAIGGVPNVVSRISSSSGTPRSSAKKIKSSRGNSTQDLTMDNSVGHERGGSAEDADLLAELRAISMKNT
eukprot:scaffold6640_cov113-Chaetoceros_neogracile.AAC.1